MNVNIPQLADTLFERTASTSWVVVFKSLTATHHTMVYGNEVSETCMGAQMVRVGCEDSVPGDFFHPRALQLNTSSRAIYNGSDSLVIRGARHARGTSCQTHSEFQLNPYPYIHTVMVPL